VKKCTDYKVNGVTRGTTTELGQRFSERLLDPKSKQGRFYRPTIVNGGN